MSADNIEKERPTMTGEHRSRLVAALMALPDGPWEVWTSCSFRRISRRDGGDGDVLCGVVQRSDGHPDLSMNEKQLQALCDLRNLAVEIAGVDMK
jgi:hypothetical protein